MPTFSKPLSTPMFNFPKEPPRRVQKEDIFKILLMYSRSADIRPQISKPSRENNCNRIIAKLANDPAHKRHVFRPWPRAVDGQTMKSTFPGKSTPNDFELWGETLFDFFKTERVHGMFGAMTISTSSKMLAFVEANNELEAAPEEIKWAKREKSPRVIHLYPIVNSLEAHERNIANGCSGKPLHIDDSVNQTGAPKPQHPDPWPIMPFSYQPPTLQQKLPLHRLPKEIVVHDPWNLLAVSYLHMSDEIEVNDEPWDSRPDVTHKYRLQLTPAGEARLQEDLAAEKNAPSGISIDDADHTLSVDLVGEESHSLHFDDVDRSTGTLIRPPEGVYGCIPPAPYVYRSPRPENPPQVGEAPEAHLYLSPSHPIGKGHHSMVYNAEWELPRSTLVHEEAPHWVLCERCVEEDAEKQLIEMDGENGERKEERWKELTGYFVKLDYQDDEPIRETFGRANDDGSISSFEGVIDPGTKKSHSAYSGPVRPLRSRVEWQDSHNPTCIHLKPVPNPPLARVRVTAKLSMNEDRHLAREAGNYQRFEPHMSEHWSGYNIVQPSFKPVPVGPIVPRFYGYYVPVKDELEKGPEAEDTNCEDDSPSDSSQDAYLSPILLLENCGIPVDPADLTKDERNEASSLFRRFHYAGWYHNSVYARNILVQYGPLDLPPWERKYDKENRELSFRIIDFGRSEYDEKNRGQIFPPGEHRRVEALFRVGIMEW